MAASRPPGPKDFLLFEKWMDATAWLLEKTQRYPKTLRHSLATRTENLALGILEEITAAGFQSDKQAPLRRADEKLNRLRVLVRLAHELKALSHGHYEEAAQRMAEAGRILGALRHPRSPGDDAGADV